MGLNPVNLALQQGPLTISALGVDPPERSVQFHLTLMSLQDGVARLSPYVPTLEELEIIFNEARRLNTRLLTLVKGERLDHGLVWEDGSLELGLAPSRYVDGNAVPPYLPEGDGEPLLRRFIDDSVNLLSGLAFNEERLDKGLAPLNLLWPWGAGFRVPLPNLALRRGEATSVESNSLRIAGVTRLAGYRHGHRSAFGRGLNTRLERIVERASTQTSLIAVIDAATQLGSRGKIEELQWFAHELDTRLFGPLLDRALREPWDVTIVSPGGYTGDDEPEDASLTGLGLEYRSGPPPQNSHPFDERSLEERSIPTVDVWDFVDRSLST